MVSGGGGVGVGCGAGVGGGVGVGVGCGGIPSDYLVSTQLHLWLFCCWGCGCCWAVTICNGAYLKLG